MYLPRPVAIKTLITSHCSPHPALDESDGEYTRKYDEDLSTSLVSMSPLHVEHWVLGRRYAGWSILCMFVVDVQSKFEPDPNEVTAAYT